MKYGVSIIPNTEIMPITQLALAVEERGLDALFMGEHIHIPVKPRIPYPLPTMSSEYLRELDLIRWPCPPRPRRPGESSWPAACAG